MRRPAIAVVGAGVAGAIVVDALKDRSDVEVVCLERAQLGDHAEAGTGLNIGPNALKSLQAYFPQTAARVMAASLPWQRWTTCLVDGTVLWDLDLSEVADRPGVRIRWSVLYRVLREPLGDAVEYGCEVTRFDATDDGVVLHWTDASGAVRSREFDLVIGADGHFGASRASVAPETKVRHLGVALSRTLFPAPPETPIDDYSQWFNGPARLLAFRIPGDLVYCAASFPIEPGAAIPESMKRADALRAVFTDGCEPSPTCAALLQGLYQHAERLHWARAQEGEIVFARPEGRLVLIGDAAHPMAPTLGQGATQAIEDACVTAEQLIDTLETRTSLGAVGAAIARRRAERVRYVMDASWRASDTLLSGADPVRGTLWKKGPGFRETLRQVYCGAPVPGRVFTESVSTR